MSSAVNKTIREIKKREEIKKKALEKGWRSRWTLLFKAWSGADRGSHLEWLGFYDEAHEVRMEYSMTPADMLKLTAEVSVGMLTGVANSELASGGIYDSTSNTLYTGHISNNVGYGSLFKKIRGTIYLAVEQIAIIFGKYEKDAFGLPVCWFEPKE